MPNPHTFTGDPKKACYMIVNNRRLGSKGYIVAGRDSEFLTLNGVDKYRDILIF